MAKNWALFLLVSVLILGGWIYLEHVLTPVPQRKEEEAKKEAPKKDEAEKKKPKPKKKQPQNTKAPPPKTPSTFKPEIVTLGEASEESKYHLQVQLTTRGGGVQGVILNKFREADADGREVPGELLHLVPSDPDLPSNLLFHFGNPDEKDHRPLVTLGQQKWEIVPPGKQTKEGVQRVTFRAEIKGLHLRLSKTYELAPGTYHLGLSIQIEDTRKKGEEARRFRYQLAGAHGLPIEGKWYTNVYRNALIGIVDNRGTLQRSVEDSRRISVRAGGERVPEVNNNLPIQYAGIVTQFFASVTVVDNTGADKTVPPKILEWARPTLESTEIRGRIVSLDRNDKRFGLLDEEKVLHRFVLAKNGTVHLNSENDTFDDLVEAQPVFVRFYFGENRPSPGGKGVLQIARAIHSIDDPHKPQFDDISVRVNTTPVQLKPGETTTHKYLLYNGPVKVRLLGQFTGIKEVPGELVDRYENDLHLDTLTDYHSDSWFGWFANKIYWTKLLIICTNLMHDLLNFLHKFIPWYGICIILLTVIVRGLMFPVSRKQALLSIRMQELAPELKKVQEKYKNDPQGRTHATMDLYRKHGVNPLGGCLPLLMQMPVFLGLYYCLQESIFFRLASFLWIDNLAAPDMLFRWGDGIPIISSPSNMGGLGYLGPYFNLLPVLAVTLMIMQQKMLTPPPTDEQQATQQKIMKYMMVVIGIMFYKVAAGLCIYFTASSLWGLAERKLLPRRKTAPGASSAPTGGSSAKPVSRPSPKPRKPAPQKKPEADGAFQKVRNWWAEVLKQAKKK
jgi:YidC/Oxa1 family membrane protein insertase